MPLSQQKFRTQETHPQLTHNLELLLSLQTTAPMKYKGRRRTYIRLSETLQQRVEEGLERQLLTGEDSVPQGHLAISGDSFGFHNVGGGNEVLLAANG